MIIKTQLGCGCRVDILVGPKGPHQAVWENCSLHHQADFMEHDLNELALHPRSEAVRAQAFVTLEKIRPRKPSGQRILKEVKYTKEETVNDLEHTLAWSILTGDHTALPPLVDKLIERGILSEALEDRSRVLVELLERLGTGEAVLTRTCTRILKEAGLSDKAVGGFFQLIANIEEDT